MATLRNLRHNTENAGQVGKPVAGRVTRTRAAMTDIGNNVPVQKLTDIPKKDGLVSKPARALTRQKATTVLQQEVTGTRVTRRSAEQKVTQQQQDEPMEVDNMVTVAFSSTSMEAAVEDIDKADRHNPQLVVEYVNEIYAYMRHLELVQSIRQDYLNKATGTSLLPKMRAVLVDWLVQVHEQFSLLQETLYLTIAILDRFLQDAACKIERKQLQLVGVAAMFIAAKYEEMYAPEISDFVYITDRAYTESQIREMEIRIMATLEFELGRPLPLHFLRRNSKAGGVDANVHTLAKYAMELTIGEYKMAHIRPSLIAASALAFAIKVFDDSSASVRQLWSPTLVHYTSYSFEDISKTLVDLANVVYTTSRSPESGKLMAVRKKYSHKKFVKIAQLPELTGQDVEQMASGDF